MIHLDKLSASEAERLAYAEGYVGTAQLFARIDRLETECAELLEQIEQLTDAVKDLIDCQYDIERNDEVVQAISNAESVLRIVEGRI